MARSHGRISATIWNDPDFVAMRGGAQRLFMFLLSQPDLNHAGLIPMRVKRWATKAEDIKPAGVRDELDYLTNRRFVVFDEDTEEVLIRTFVRNDGVYKQPKVMLRMREDARQIESNLLRAAFRAELERLPLDELSTSPTGRNGEGPSTREVVEGVVDTLRADFASSLEYPSEGVSDTPSDTPHVRAGALPLPPTPVPQPPTPVPTSSGAASPSREIAAQDVDTQGLVGEWIDHCQGRPPSRVIGQVSKELKQMLTEGIDPDRVRAGLAEWNRRGLHPSTLPSVVHEISNRVVVSSRQATTDDLFARAEARMTATARQEIQS